MKYSFLTLVFCGALAVPAFAQVESKPKAAETPTLNVTTGPQTAISTPTPQTPKAPDWMEQARAMEQTTVEWMEAEHDFGKIIEGDIAKYTFHFKNTGEYPLKLVRVKASCGCTTPSFSDGEIAPGEEGYVEIAFNSAHKVGFQNKAVTVTGNFEGTNMVLRFKGEVVAKPAETVSIIELADGFV
ncbi:MAG: DUF1573 domain-containing protein, partial [Bacteroidia bacterium]|nr:DUF1573 domain-containing protein [Bacteroidia bacterium]